MLCLRPIQCQIQTQCQYAYIFGIKLMHICHWMAAYLGLTDKKLYFLEKIKFPGQAVQFLPHSVIHILKGVHLNDKMSYQSSLSASCEAS